MRPNKHFRVIADDLAARSPRRSALWDFCCIVIGGVLAALGVALPIVAMVVWFWTSK